MFTVSLHLHRHHNTYATILIAPSEKDSMCISNKIWQDNNQREDIIEAGGSDPGRNGDTNWFEVSIRIHYYMNRDLPLLL